MSNFKRLGDALVDLDQVRSIRSYVNAGIPPYICVTYNNGSEDNIDSEDPVKAITELQRVIVGNDLEGS